MSALEKPVVVVEMSDSGLVRQRWVFCLHGLDLVLSRYHHERRYSTEQPFRTTKFYDRLRDSGDNYGDWQWLAEADVPITEGLQSRALAELTSRIKVVLPSEPS